MEMVDTVAGSLASRLETVTEGGANQDLHVRRKAEIEVPEGEMTQPWWLTRLEFKSQLPLACLLFLPESATSSSETHDVLPISSHMLQLPFLVIYPAYPARGKPA